MYSALRRAVERGDLSALHAALEHGADIEEADMHGDRGLPLRVACFKGYATIVEELIKRGANVNAPNAQGPGGPLRMAAKGQHRDIVDLLIAHGAEIPPDLTLPTAEQHGERRKRVDRRKRNAGPPAGLRERRQARERRVTSVREVTLTDGQWETYFSQSQPMPAPLPHDDLHDSVSLVFERVRD